MSLDIRNCDNMDLMRGFPDKHFDLAIVDPPYGIGRDGGETGKNWKRYTEKNWDHAAPSAPSAPSETYFKELFRVSKNQIIWGANYFTDFIPASMGWIVWDKGQELTMSDGELAYSSFDKALRIFRYNRCYIGEMGGLLHPTQKPVRLYKRLLDKYAKPGDKILDTHLGSGSIAIACHDYGFDLTACELDKDYYEAAMKRITDHTNQLKIAI